MAQTMVKILFHNSHRSLQDQLNAWLTEIAGTATITGVTMDSNNYGHCIAILYQQDGQGRLYRGHVFFHNSHSSLEQAANAGLEAAQAEWGRFVAIGSNEYGHCLCIIEEQ